MYDDDLPKNRDQQPISLFFSRQGRRIKHVLHCLCCGLRFYATTMILANGVDNGGPTDKDYGEVMCKRCKQMYRIYVL